MTCPKVIHYGSWKSPITTDLIVSKTVGIAEPSLVGGDIYWLEMRPEEQGRHVVVMRSSDGETRDITSPNYNARTRVHEYGGASYMVDGDTVFFSNFIDQRLYRQDRSAQPRPITQEGPYRYADSVIDRNRGRLICVCEDHASPDPGAVVNTIVSIPLNGRHASNFHILVEGSDFYSSPRLSPDNKYLAWISWNHPNMPWDSSGLWLARLDSDGIPTEPRLIAGGSDESILQPKWSPHGDLYFISDRSGWWNLYRWRNGKVETILAMSAEFADPPWMFGQSNYAFESETSIICAYKSSGLSHLARIDTVTGLMEEFETPYTSISYVNAQDGQVIFLASSPSDFPSVVSFDLVTHKHTILRRANDINIDPGYVSLATSIEFPTENGLTAHALFYPTKNQDYLGPAEERPPLLVMSHGGPTAASDIALNLMVQYWTSRGIAVLDVNYGGSSGYGRSYRQRLNGQWGIVDVDDCVNGARYLVKQGLVDGNRLAIRGGSAGGYTTLSALTFRDAFKAGCSYYGVSDLEALARGTHKFESHYLERLIGPYPETIYLYKQRSPLNAVDRLSCPIIFFQGLDDKIVPPNQAVRMFDAIKRKGIPTAYISFESEQHGLRRAENIKRSLEAELYFYSQVFCFDLAEGIEPVQIENIHKPLMISTGLS